MLMCVYTRIATRFSAFFIIAALSMPFVAHAQLGISGGLGMNVISQPSFSGPGNDLSTSAAFNAAIFYNFPLGQWDIRPSISTQKNDFDWDLDDVEIFSTISGDFRVAELSVDVRYRFEENGNTFYALIGPELNFVAANRAELRQVLKYEEGSTSYYGINLGVGYRLELENAGIAIEPELRYSQALDGFMTEDHIVRTISYDGDDERSLSNLTLRVSFSFLGFN